ncbi:MAG: hypothetical protein AAFY65_08340 [Pseudomonadota bacterium]
MMRFILNRALWAIAGRLLGNKGARNMRLARKASRVASRLRK